MKHAGNVGVTNMESSSGSEEDEDEGEFGVNMVGGMRIKELDNDLEIFQFDPASDEEQQV